MKLLFCDECGSIFSLAIQKLKSCDCGRVKGHYQNHRIAITNGKGYALGMGTGSLSTAMYRLRCETDDGLSRKDYISKFPVITWLRPHDGEGNPHTTVSEIFQFLHLMGEGRIDVKEEK